MIRQLNKLARTAPLLRQATLLLHRGSEYVCPFCNYHSRDLFALGHNLDQSKLPDIIGGGKRRAGCYNCGSDDRERLVYMYLKSEMRLFDRGRRTRILHLAPEKQLSQKLLDFGFEEYICGDLFTLGYRYPAHVRNISVLSIPFSNNYFDLVICNHVLEHVPDDRKAMGELCRVLHEDGEAILQVPIAKALASTFEDSSITDPRRRELAFGQSDHVRVYGQDYTDRLTDCGFSMRRINIVREYPECGLNRDEDLFIGRKKHKIG